MGIKAEPGALFKAWAAPVTKEALLHYYDMNRSVEQVPLVGVTFNDLGGGVAGAGLLQGEVLEQYCSALGAKDAYRLWRGCKRGDTGAYGVLSAMTTLAAEQLGGAVGLIRHGAEVVAVAPLRRGSYQERQALQEIVEGLGPLARYVRIRAGRDGLSVVACLQGAVGVEVFASATLYAHQIRLYLHIKDGAGALMGSPLTLRHIRAAEVDAVARTAMDEPMGTGEGELDRRRLKAAMVAGYIQGIWDQVEGRLGSTNLQAAQVLAEAQLDQDITPERRIKLESLAGSLLTAG